MQKQATTQTAAQKRQAAGEKIADLLAYPQPIIAALNTLEAASKTGRQWQAMPEGESYCRSRVIFSGDQKPRVLYANVPPLTDPAIIFRATHDGTRLEIGGSVSGLAPGMQADAASITVDPFKAPAAIAQDIIKRLLPDYLPRFNQARAEYLSKAQQIADTEKLYNELEAASRGTIYPDDKLNHERGNDGLKRHGRFNARGLSVYGGVSTSRDAASLELSVCPHDLALRIAATIADYIEEQERQKASAGAAEAAQ